MKNNQTLLNTEKEVTMQDIISFIKNNTNPLEVVLNAVIKATNNTVVINKSKKLTTLNYKNSTIIIGECYNPYPNKQCYVL